MSPDYEHGSYKDFKKMIIGNVSKAATAKAEGNEGTHYECI